MGLLAALLLPAGAHAALDVQAKAVKTESNEKEEIWAIRIDPTKTHGPGKIDAKPESLQGHPLCISSADLPGVIFGFDAAAKLSAIEITDPARAKLPGKAILGKSGISDLDAAFGHGTKPDPASDPFGPAKSDKKPVEPAFSPGTKPDPLPAGVTDARQFQFAGSRITFSDTAVAPGIGTMALLEKAS